MVMSGLVMSMSLSSSMMPATRKTTIRGPFGLDGFAEAARAAVVERGDVDHASAASAGGEHAAAPGAGERGDALRQSRRQRGRLAGRRRINVLRGGDAGPRQAHNDNGQREDASESSDYVFCLKHYEIPSPGF